MLVYYPRDHAVKRFSEAGWTMRLNPQALMQNRLPDLDRRHQKKSISGRQSWVEYRRPIRV